MSDSVEKEIGAFLANLPPLTQRFLQYDWSCLSDPSYSPAEIRKFCKWLEKREPKVRHEFESILKRDRAKWNEYCRKAVHVETATAPYFQIAPKGKAGRPKKDALAEEAAQLQRRGMNYPQIAAELNKKHGPKTATAESVRKLLTRRHQPDKTND